MPVSARQWCCALVFRSAGVSALCAVTVNWLETTQAAKRALVMAPWRLLLAAAAAAAQASRNAGV